jgi:hypothetical protein
VAGFPREVEGVGAEGGGGGARSVPACARAPKLTDTLSLRPARTGAAAEILDCIIIVSILCVGGRKGKMRARVRRQASGGARGFLGRVRAERARHAWRRPRLAVGGGPKTSVDFFRGFCSARCRGPPSTSWRRLRRQDSGGPRGKVGRPPSPPSCRAASPSASAPAARRATARRQREQKPASLLKPSAFKRTTSTACTFFLLHALSRQTAHAHTHPFSVDALDVSATR